MLGAGIAGALVLALAVGLVVFWIDSGRERSAWKLVRVAPDRSSIQILNAEGCGGEIHFNHAEFDEVPGGLDVTVVNRTPRGGCDSDAIVARRQVELPRRLGVREAIFGDCVRRPAQLGCDAFDGF